MKHITFITGLLTAAMTTWAAERFDHLTLEQATQVALQNHRSLRVSHANVVLAEAQYQQAMAAFGPHLNVEAGFQRADQDRTFTFAGAVQMPTMDIGSALAPLTGPLPLGAATLPSQTIPMNMEVKMFDRDVARAALNLSYPIYTGGRKEATTAMARKGVQIALEEKRKTALEVVHDVNKYYHGAQYAQQMTLLTSDTLERFQALEALTEKLYQNASLKVKRTDYLRSKTTTALVSSTVQEARYASTLAHDALANAMGLDAGTQLHLAPEVAPSALDLSLENLISDAMQLNPDKQRLMLAIAATEHRIDEAKSGYLPVIGLEASLYQVWNGYKDGLFNDANRAGWTIGVGLKWDVFDGGMTRASVDAAQAVKMKLQAQHLLLDSGLSLQIKDGVLRIQRSRQQLDDSTRAHGFAQENRQLNVRAYQEALVETKDVIEAQLVESFAGASRYRANHELRTALADLELQVGRAVQQHRP